MFAFMPRIRQAEEDYVNIVVDDDTEPVYF